MGKQVAIVTGANRGIGLSVVRYLCKTFHGDVILTSRRTANGQKAVQILRDQGLNPKFYELDITQSESIWMFRKYIEEHHGGIDILINNAGVSFQKDEKVPVFLKANMCFEVDFFGTMNVCKIMFPLLRPHTRIVIVTNGYVAKLSCLKDNALSRFKADGMGLYDLECLANDYLKTVKFGTHAKWGWPESPCPVVKLFLVKLTEILARMLKDDNRRNILVNACCPGWTQSGGSVAYVDDNGKCDGVSLQTTDAAACDVANLGLLDPGTRSPCGELVRHLKVISKE